MRSPLLRSALVGCCLAPACPAGQAGWAGQAVVKVYGAAETGEDGMSWAVAQDRDGVMHFGGDGLISFDGARWRSDPAGTGYAVRGLDVAPDGRIWAAATGELGWFAQDDAGAWRFHSLRARLPADEQAVGELWAAYANGGGALFVGRQTLYWWDGDGFRVEPFFTGSRIPALRAGGRWFVHQLTSGLWEVGAGGRRLVAPRSELTGAVVWLEPAEAGWLLGTSQGFLRLDRGRAAPVMAAASEFVRRNRVTQIRRLGPGRIAIATLGGGIAVADESGRLLRVFDRGSGLPTDEVFALGLDREGGLWGAAGAALFRLSLAGDPWWYRARDPAERSTCVGIAAAGGEIAIAADSAVLAVREAEHALVEVPGPPLHFWSLAGTPAGILAAANREIMRLDGNRLVSFRRLAADAYAVGAAGPGALAVAAGREVLILDAGTGETRRVIRGLPDAAGTLAARGDGELFLGTPRAGVLRADPATGRLQPVPGLPAAGSALVASGAAGTIWAFGSAAGWAMAPGDPGFRPIAGYPGRRAAACDAADGVAWIVHPAEGGLGPCVAAVEAGRWRPRLIEGLERIGIPEAIHAERRGDRVRLWIGGTEGVLTSDVEAEPGPATIPIPRAELHLGGRRVPGSAATVGYAMPEVMLRAMLPSYGLRPAFVPQWRVDGIDADWAAVGADGRRRLSSLREGAYRIRVRTLAASGETSPEAELALTVRPPWWRTWPLAAAAILTAAALGLLLHRWRSAALRRRNARLERAVALRTAEAAQAQAEKTRLIAGISHDIRNPLSAIVGMSLGLEEAGLDEPQRRLVESMRSCARYLDGLVADVIDFARVESGEAALQPERCRPAELLREIAAIVRADAEAAGAVLRLTADPNVPPVIWADPGRIRQILVNLATNAIKHAGGEIELAVGTPPANPGGLEFSVRDHGPGIGAADQARLFRPFSRGADQAGRPPGSGLGLATSKRWAELMGGTITLASVEGAGTRAALRLPVAAPPEGGPERPPARTYRRVLIVEDDDYNHWAISAVLARFGATVAARARTGREALALAAESEFDLVTLDRRLPDRDGVDVCRELRARGAKLGPIVALSACASAADRSAWRAAGADAFVAKPLTPDKLRAALAGAEPEAGAPGLNLALLRVLADPGHGGLAGAVARYQAELDASVAAVRAAFFAGARPAVARAAHRLASHLRMVDATPEARLALALEAAARTPGEDLDALAAEVFPVAGRLAPRLQALEQADDPRTGAVQGSGAADEKPWARA